MQDKTIISGLTRTRRELTCEIEALLSRIDAIADNVRAIDQVMLLYRPDMVPEAIPALRYRPREDWAAKGEVQRAIFAVLREAGEPMDGAAITLAVMEARGVDPADYALHRKRIGRTLDKLRARGLVASSRDGARMLWKLAR